ncbi:hypothetical protein KC799_06960 [candidate division KSB1 bacterium]|nr:hypothetical protein [candidate division KSB1 bacterium]
MTEIGKLLTISPRDAWKHEAHDFTPWLSENLEQLGDAIGLQLEPDGTEVAVGPFSADILAKDMFGRMVLIENQLESTDHNHLGQILTYLSGLEAEIIIWIATDFREPHLSAINWLNENTNDKFSFFAIRLRVVRINHSIPAPVFDVLARPNQWERSMQKKVRETTGESSSFAAARREFWQYYLQRYPDDAQFGVQITGSPSNWLATPKHIGMFVSIYKAKTGVGVFLRGQRGVIPSEIQAQIAPYANEFKQLVGTCEHLGDENNHPGDSYKIDTENIENWDEAIDWLHERAHAFLSALKSLVK